MTTHFTCPVLIEKNTREIRDRLRTLGYVVEYIKECPENFGWATGAGHAVILPPEAFDHWTTSVPNAKRVNCGTNEAMFFALAALRNDKDFMQWFYCGDDWFLCKIGHFDGYAEHCQTYPEFWGHDYYKATPDEIVEHFKNG